MVHEDALKLTELKRCLVNTNYFVVNKSTAFEPCFLLYRKGDKNNTYVLKRSNIDVFVANVKRIVGLNNDVQPGGIQNKSVTQQMNLAEPQKQYWWQQY